MDKLIQDLRYAVRALRRSPGFTLIAVLTLALGIGANTAVFSVVNGVLLKPLPYPDAERVTYLGVQWEEGALARSATATVFSYIEENARTFEGITTFRSLTASLGDEPGAGWVEGIRISEDFFTVVGTSPALGRGFTQAENEPGGPSVTVLSHNVWQNRLAGDPGILGRTIRLDDEPHTIVGVLPESFRFVGFENQTDVLVPLQLDPDPRDLGQNYTMLARIASGISPERVEADLARVFQGLRGAYPEQAANRSGFGLLDYQDIYMGELSSMLFILLGATLFVLLIACANVANLFLARATGRRREIATRAALGAGKGRIVRQLLTESLVLGALAGIAGLLIGIWSLDGLLAAAPQSIPRADDIGLDARVLGFTALIALGTAIVFGLTSALTSSRLDLTSALRGGGRGEAGDRARNRARNILIVAETAVSLVLLIGAGLLITSFVELTRVDPGFNARNLLTVEIERAPSGYEDAQQIWRFEEQALERIRAIPGVESAAGVSMLPLDGQYNFPMAVEGRPEASEGAIQLRFISDGYFETIGTPILRGRGLTRADISGPPVIVINQATANRYWPEGGALGKRIIVGMMGDEMVPGFTAIPREIIGIAADMRALGLERSPERMIFVPQAQLAPGFTAGMPALVIRAENPSAILPAVTRAIQEIDPGMTELEFRTMEEIMAESLGYQSFALLLMTLFAGIALVLTALGIYGVTSYSVGQRAKEIGVRIALGAGRGDVVGLVVRQGMVPTLIGLGIGLGTAFGLTRVLSSMLYGVGARDPVTFAAVTLLIAIVGLAAAYIPARRATRVNPNIALRAE